MAENLEAAAGAGANGRRGVISEIYATLQGEGLLAGEPQIFVRLAGCPWRCHYCDTPGSLRREGHRAYGVEEVLDEIHRLQERREHRTIAVTGGEPLAQADFLADLLPVLRRFNWQTYLESSGTQPDALRRVVDQVDIVAMDLKPASAIGREFWREHEEFLRVAGSKVFAKLVLTADVTDAEVDAAVRLLAKLEPAPPLVLQPVTAVAHLSERLGEAPSGARPRVAPPSPHKTVAWWESARQRLPDVRLIPQLHPLWRAP